CGGVRGMDAAAKPTGTYSRRPPQPDPPRHPTECPLLLLLRLLLLLLLLLRPLQVPGAARPKPLQHPICALGRIEYIARRELLAQVMQ
ncbi:hypothetical protein DBR20_13005, partial [Stenotrophomonas sp. HMWF023]